MDKHFIFYCDDKIEWTKKFKLRHSNEFEIETITNGKEFMQRLSELIKQRKTPDIILIDLFHPKYDSQHANPIEKEKVEKKGEEAITQLEQDIETARISIYGAWKPYGLDMLEQARKLCPDVPIAIYTQQGLSIVDDEELLRVSKLKGEWMLKGRDDFYESKRLHNMLEKTTYAKITRRSLRTLSGVILIISFIYSWMMDKSVDFILTLGISLSIALMPNLISIIERRTGKKY